MKKSYNFIFLMIISVMLFSSYGCGSTKNKESGHTYQIYYIDHDETRIVPMPYITETVDTDQLVSEMLAKLSDTDQAQYEPTIESSFKVLSAKVDNGQVTVDFDQHYLSMDTIREILTRAALVNTFTQIKGISTVSFTIKGQALATADGTAVGPMTADMFIDNAGKEIDSSQNIKINLYFANKNGDKLIETNRTVIYNANIPIEKLVVEQIISGPVVDSAYPVIDPHTKLLSVTTKDGICYVNLDKSFLNQKDKVTSDVAIYSIVNSLVELSNVNKVQFSVDGDTNVNYRDNTSLAVPFERNLDIMQ